MASLPNIIWMTIATTAKIIAKNPPSIAMLIGGIIILTGQPEGWLAFFSGVGLQIFWISN